MTLQRSAGVPRQPVPRRRWLPVRLVVLAVLGVAASAAAAPLGTDTQQSSIPATSASAPATAANAGKAVNLAPIGVLASPEPDPAWQMIELHRHGALGDRVAVTVGIPFPPGALADARQVTIRDEQGRPIPAHIEATLHWYVAPGGIRAVRAQFHVALHGDHRTLHFAIGEPIVDTTPDWPYADGLVDDADGIPVPGVLATLTPQWMSASLIAGPQQPAVPERAYDRYFADQFRWARALPREDGSAWLFDRPSTLFQQYVRTGREDYLAAAVQSYRFYMSHLRRHAPAGWPLCGGGWSLGEVNACDPKYIYVEPILFALGLTGDDSQHDDALIGRMIGTWDSGGWNAPAGPYAKPGQWFTEREAGLGLLATVSAYEVTGDRRYLDAIHHRLDWLYQHQQHNPDGLGADGSWRNSWQVHEGEERDPATDIRGSSPWMSENIVDGLWHAWLVTGDKRIPVMLTAFGRYLEQHGWIDRDTMTAQGVDWRDPCSGPDGQISWYWSSAHASTSQLVAVQNSDGWYSDFHDVELMLPVALARYFETDPVQQRALDRRLSLLANSYAPACAENRTTARRFNWNNRGVGVVQWLLQHHAAAQ